MTITLTSPRPAAARKAVAFCCDDHYLPYALFAADQIARLHPQRDFDICICGEQVPVIPPGLSGLGLRPCGIATQGAFEGLRLDARRTESAYLRLALPQVFAGDYDRLLYLDSDIFVQGGDFSHLLDLDLRGHAVAAVRDTMQWRSPGRRPEQFRRFGWPAAPYFNSGVLLIDVAAYRDAGLFDRAVALGRKEKDRLIGHDQTLLNCVLRGRWAELSPTWNWQYSWSARMSEAMLGANIVHFIGADKPWKDPRNRFPPRFARAVAAFLARHYPEHAAVPVGRGPASDSRYMRRMLLRQALSARRMARYLNRFPDDLTLLA